MKALIRPYIYNEMTDNEVTDFEIWPESKWTQWTYDHLEWLTTPRPDGDGYTLIEDYKPEEEMSE